jgi:hypothetical protein
MDQPSSEICHSRARGVHLGLLRERPLQNDVGG